MSSVQRGKTVTKQTGHAEDPPDAGYGIVVVFAAFTVYLLTSMMTKCAGVLYLSWQNEFNSSASQTGAIASVMSSCAYFGSILSGVACNRYGCRSTWIWGGLVVFLASFLSFWASHLYQMYIIGTFLGVGVSSCFLAATVAVGEYIKKHYAIAMGFTSAGIASAMIVFPPLFRLLLDTYGWRGTMLITAALFSNICVAGALYRPPRQTGWRRRLKESEPIGHFNIDSSDNAISTKDQSLFESYQQIGRTGEKKCRSLLAIFSGLFSEFRFELLLKSYRFSLFCLIGVEFNIAYSCFLIYLIPMAQDCGIDEGKAPFLLSVMGFGSLGARILSGFFVTRKIPVESAFTLSIVLCCVGLLCAQAESYASLAASACIVGIGTGAHKALGPVLLRKIVGLPNIASGLGIVYLFGGIGDLVGPIFAGMLYDTTGSFSAVFYVLAGIVSVTSLQMLLLPVLRRMEPGLEEEEETPAQV